MLRFLVAFSLIAPFAHAVNVTGTATFKGKLPKPETINMSSQPDCAKAHKAPVPKEEILVNDGGLANVFVYVKDGVDKTKLPKDTPAPVTLDQQGCLYVPRVLGVQVGQTLKFVNSDAMFHNVNGGAKQNKRFNHGMNQKGQVIETKFTKPEVMVKVKCDVHGWMVGYIGVLDHPFFSVTDPKGAFTIAGLPPGEYTLEAWHEKLGTQTAKVKVEGGAMSPVTFAFDKAVN